MSLKRVAWLYKRRWGKMILGVFALYGVYIVIAEITGCGKVWV